MIKHIARYNFLRIPTIFTGLLIAVLVTNFVVLESAQARDTLLVPEDFDLIQDAVDAASPGDVIQVASGTYNENVIVTIDELRLQADGDDVVLDGSDLGGIGIHVLGTDGVRISGFIVENFEAGIVLEVAEDSRIRNIETRFNDSDTASLRDGLQLVDSHHNRIRNVYAHDNGHNGITLKSGSSNNDLKKNVTNDNGKNLAVGLNFGGCGIQLISSGNDNNSIIKNEAFRNGWGIQVGGGSNDNKVIRNESHENQRAGVVVLEPGSNNLIVRNDAEGNGTADVAPSGTFDLFDQGELNNKWLNNQGSFNF